MRKRIQSFDPRQNMRRKSFEIFHYQDAKPTGVEVHHHDFYEVYFFLDGNVEYRVEGKLYQLTPGDLLLISPMELHQPLPKESGSYERIVLWVDREYLESFSTEGADLTRCFDSSLPAHTNLLRPTLVQRSELMMMLGRLVQESYGENYGSELYARGVLLQFMVELNRLAQIAVPDKKERDDGSPLVSQVLAYIGEHYQEELSLETLAQRFYVSKYHLSHEFSRVMGIGVYRYVMLKRLLIARQMLAEGASPGAACSGCGFSDYANFYRAFKTQYGISPGACALKE